MFELVFQVRHIKTYQLLGPSLFKLLVVLVFPTIFIELDLFFSRKSDCFFGFVLKFCLW